LKDGVTDMATIGVIASDIDKKEEYEKVVFPSIIESDVVNINPNIQFIIKDAKGDANIHQRLVKSFYDIAVDLIIGGEWSNAARKSRGYAQSKTVLLFSPSFTDPDLEKSNDNLYRLVTNDYPQDIVIAKPIRELEKKSVLVLHRNDKWGRVKKRHFSHKKPTGEGRGRRKVRLCE